MALVEVLAPDEDKTFRKATILFVGSIISMIGYQMVGAICIFEMAKNYGMHWVLSLVQLMPVLNCMLWII
jgi:hypothetical protein